MEEMSKVDFSDELALRVWCFEKADTYSDNLTKRIEIAERIYRFIKSTEIEDVESVAPRIVNINVNLDGD